MTSPFGCANAIGCDNCDCKEICLDEQHNLYENKRFSITRNHYDDMSEEEHLYWEKLAEKLGYFNNKED